jgi:hypothetical protein
MTKEKALDLEGAIEFLRRYYPNLWDRIDEQDIAKLLELSHGMFKSKPELIAATTNPRYLPLQ